LQEAGYNVLPAEKGADSIKSGIDELKACEITYTEDSKNIAHETQEYKWALDKNKEPTNEPVDEFNHAMDATRYGYSTHKHQPKPDAY
jgi:phage terminase large subunit